MPNDNIKSARQMIDDLINDDPEKAKQSFHDFLKAKTISKLNPEEEAPLEIDDIQMGDDGESVDGDEIMNDDDDISFTDDDEDPDNDSVEDKSEE